MTLWEAGLEARRVRWLAGVLRRPSHHRPVRFRLWDILNRWSYGMDWPVVERQRILRIAERAYDIGFKDGRKTIGG